MTKFNSIPLSDSESVFLKLRFEKVFEQKRDEYAFRNIELSTSREIKEAVLKVQGFAMDKFKINYNSIDRESLKTKRFDEGAVIHPKYTILLMDHVNSFYLLRISIRGKTHLHTNKSNPFKNSSILDEFANKQIFGSVVSLGNGNSGHGFNISIENFLDFDNFNMEDVNKCFSIFVKYANIILTKNDENDLFITLYN